MVVGLGSGTTATIAVQLLGERVARGLRIVGVPTSRVVERQARALGIPLTTLEQRPRIDLTIDGADEIEPNSLALIKGRGGALLREKLVALASEVEVIIADDSKLVKVLGERAPLPVEIVPFGWRRTAEAVQALGCQAVLRRHPRRRDRPYLTDGGHYLLDCRFPPIADPSALAASIKGISGVVESGLFIGLAHRAVVAGSSGVQVIERR